MNFSADDLISDIVANDYRTAKVFKKYDIGFCCSGNINLKKASDKKNIDIDVLVAELEAIRYTPEHNEIKFSEWPIDLLSDYIVKIHHRYAREQIQPLTEYLEKISKVHGRYRPELKEIRHLFRETAIVLSAHMKGEEETLFPMFRQLAFQQDVDERLMKALIHNLIEEHENEDEQFMMIRELSNNYSLPHGACNTYRVAYGLLKEFDNDLQKHTHLENNVLFPSALEMIGVWE